MIVLLAAVLVLLCLASCSNSKGDDTDTAKETDTSVQNNESETDSETTAVGEATDWVDENGNFKYTLLRSDYNNRGVAASVKLRKFLMTAYGFTSDQVEIGTDYVDRGKEIPQDGYEFLIGGTNRNADDEYDKKEYSLQEWYVVISGNKIIINGETAESLEEAVDWLIAEYFGYSGEGTLSSFPELKDGVLEHHFLSEEEIAVIRNRNNPHLVETLYETEDRVLVDVELTADNAQFPVDPTGVKDATSSIRNAIEYVKNAGGGTVYLPAGTYLVSSTINIPPYCTLRGDWADPDTVTDGKSYGTILVADVAKSDSCANSLFVIDGSAGVRGLTIYYPRQTLSKVNEYPFTFYTTGAGNAYMLACVYNCTVINGYQGIGACVAEENAHEMFTVDTVKGTFLRTAAEVYNQADVGTWKNVYVSPKYWAECKLGESIPTRSEIENYTRKNTTGLILGDLEWTEFANLQIEQCAIGVQIVKGKRIEFAGSLYGVDIHDCDTALQVDALDTRWGMVVANANLSGSSHSINNKTDGYVKLVGTTLSGTKSGNVLQDAGADISQYAIPYESVYSKPAAHLYVVDADKTGVQDASDVIQASLNEAKATGGVVYLPSGSYRLDKPISVPAGVELRGSAGSPTRDQGGLCAGTVVYVYYGVGASFGQSDKGAVTLAGKGAGVNGIRFIYPTNSPLNETLSSTYTIVGEAADVYIVNCSIAGSAYGVDFSECDNHFIKKLITLCYYETMTLGGKGGVVEGCLQNGTVLCRCASKVVKNWLGEGQVFEKLFDPITRLYCTYIRVADGSDEKIYNTFAYGVATFAVNDGATDTLLVNIGSDNIGKNTAQTVVKSGSLAGINLMRYNGHSYDHDGGKLALYNRLTINSAKEETVIKTK